jgi:hypothetical protein
MENLNTDRLAFLADRKLQLLTHLRELTIAQQSLVSEQRVEELLTLLSRKNETLEDVKTLQQEISLFQDQDPEDRVWRSEELRGRCRENFHRCELLIAELLAIEDTSINELTQRRDLVAQQLQQFTTADAIHDAYHGVMSSAEDDQTSFSLDG